MVAFTSVNPVMEATFLASSMNIVYCALYMLTGTTNNFEVIPTSASSGYFTSVYRGGDARHGINNP